MKPSLSVSIKRVSLAIGSAITVLGATACASSPGIATPLRAAPEPAVSPPASTSLAGSVIAFAGSPEGIAIDAAGDVAVNVRNPDGVVIFPIGSPTDRKFVPLDGSARHLNLAGAYGPLLVPDETANMLIELALPETLWSRSQSVTIPTMPSQLVPPQFSWLTSSPTPST